MGDLERLLAMIQEKIEQTSHSSEELPTFECELCRDTGLITEKDEEGRLVARECKCWKARQAKRLMQQSGLAEFVDQKTFDSFVVEKEVQRKIFDTAKKYLADLTETWETNDRKPWLYIGGNPGAGKTHICTAVCGELLKQGIAVKYMQWLTESRRLKFMVNADDFEDQVAEYINPSVLYIDDLLKQKYTKNPQFSEADIKIAFTILNARYYMNKPTIISSEWDLLSDLLNADEGVFSRVYERCKGYTAIIERKIVNDFRLMG